MTSILLLASSVRIKSCGHHVWGEIYYSLCEWTCITFCGRGHLFRGALNILCFYIYWGIYLRPNVYSRIYNIHYVIRQSILLFWFASFTAFTCEYMEILDDIIKGWFILVSYGKYVIGFWKKMKFMLTLNWDVAINVNI